MKHSLIFAVIIVSLTASNTFAASSGEAWNDKDTGLTWEVIKFNQQDRYMSFSEAVSYCEELVIGDKSNWRLATKREFDKMGIDKWYNILKFGDMGRVNSWTNSVNKDKRDKKYYYSPNITKNNPSTGPWIHYNNKSYQYEKNNANVICVSP